MQNNIRVETTFNQATSSTATTGIVMNSTAQSTFCREQNDTSGDCIVVPSIDLQLGSHGSDPIVPGRRARLFWTLPKQLKDSKRPRSVIGNVAVAFAEGVDAAPPSSKVSAKAKVSHLRGGKTPLHRTLEYRVGTEGARFLRVWTRVVDREGARLCASTFLFELKGGQAYRIVEGKPKKP